MKIKTHPAIYGIEPKGIFLVIDAPAVHEIEKGATFRLGLGAEDTLELVELSSKQAARMSLEDKAAFVEQHAQTLTLDHEANGGAEPGGTILTRAAAMFALANGLESPFA